MQLNKPKVPTVYVTFTDAETRKSVGATMYDTTPDKALDEFRRAFGGEANRESPRRRRRDRSRA